MVAFAEQQWLELLISGGLVVGFGVMVFYYYRDYAGRSFEIASLGLATAKSTLIFIMLAVLFGGFEMAARQLMGVNQWSHFISFVLAFSLMGWLWRLTADRFDRWVGRN